MRISGKMSAHLFESAEAVGIRREQLLEAAGLAVPPRGEPPRATEWDTFAVMLEELSARLGGDAERMRAVGRAMVRSPSFAFLQQVGRIVLSPRALYEAGHRWVAPANVPHIVLSQDFLSPTRVRLRATLPEPHAPSLPYFYVYEGLLTQLPALLGLPPATIISSTVTPRTMHIVLELPPSSSIVGRIGRRLRAALSPDAVLDLVEEQRREMATSLASVQRSTDELRTLFDRLPDLVIVHRAGTVLWTNREVPKVLGYATADDLVGRAMLDFVDPLSRELVQSRMQGDNDDVHPDLVEVRLRTRDGDTVFVEVSPTQTVRFGGLQARLVVGRDVTERMRLRQQLRTADRMASVGMLAAGVAHEVNNPLAYVLNNIEIAKREIAREGESMRTSREALGVALEGVDRIRTIVRALLELSRVDNAAIGPVDVRSIVESTVALAAHEIAERAELETHYVPVPLARGSAPRLGQVLLNLLTNALEAMPAGARETNRLRVSVRSSGAGDVVVEVADNGVGIAPEHAARIFDPFFTTKTDGRGTGLGLAITQRLVAELGGDLSFESLPNRGTTFRLTLRSEDAAEHSLDAPLREPISPRRA
jgi:PAS domain S-box-containing protein